LHLAWILPLMYTRTKVNFLGQFSGNTTTFISGNSTAFNLYYFVTRNYDIFTLIFSHL
jgi:hypothetical protein